jgi:glutathione S-transferase
MADYYRWMFFAAGPVEQAVTNKAMGFTPTAEQERMAGYGNYDRVVDVIDQWLSGRDFVCGDRFTASDVYFGSQVMWGIAFGTLPKRTSFEEYAARLSTREAHRRAKEIDNGLIAAMSPSNLPEE